MNEKAKKGWRYSLTTWLAVVGLLVVFEAVFLNEVHRIALHHIRYWADFRHWPVNLGMAFWLFFAWLVIDAVSFRNRDVVSKNIAPPRFLHKGTRILKWSIPILLLYFLATSFISCRELVRWFYFSILVSFYFEPMTMFFYDGTMTKRLIIPPLTAITAIGFLLYLNHIFKRREQQ